MMAVCNWSNPQENCFPHNRDMAFSCLGSTGNLTIWRQTWYHHTEWLIGWLLQGNTIHPGWVSSIGVLSTNIKKYLAFSGSLPMVLLVYVMRSKYQPNNVRAFVSLFACVFLCYFAWLINDMCFMFLFIDFWLSIAITLTSKYLGLIPGSQLRDINIASTYCVFVCCSSLWKTRGTRQIFRPHQGVSDATPPDLHGAHALAGLE